MFLGITFTVYLLINLAPGGPLSILASSGEMSLSDLEALKASLGLDKPVLVRYFLWLADLLHGNLGTSYRTSQTVSMMIGQRIIPSLLLTGTGIIGAIIIEFRLEWFQPVNRIRYGIISVHLLLYRSIGAKLLFKSSSDLCIGCKNEIVSDERHVFGRI